MSTPQCLYLSQHQGKIDKILLGKRACGDLFNYLFPLMSTLAPEYADAFEGQYYGEILAIDEVPQHYFYGVYQAIITACDTIDSLKPHKSALAAALEADERFRQPLTA